MATLSELGQSFQALDPYAEFRKGQMTAQKFDIQQSVLDEQTKEIEAEKAASLGQQAAQPGQPPQLAKMANEMIPGAKLYNDDGSMTVAGQINDAMVNAAKLAKQSKMMVREASLIDNDYQRIQAMAEARRFGQTAQADLAKAREMNDKVKSDSIYAAAMAKDQTQWDAAIEAYQASGLPLPQGIPTEYSPENVKKIMALAPAALQSKINNDKLKQEEDKRRAAREERAVLAAEAKGREDGSQTKITGEVEKRLNTAEVGLKTSNKIEALLSKPDAAKALDNSQFLRSLLETPKELGSVEKYVKSNIYQKLPKESQDLVTLIVKMRNDYYRQTSGQAVTGGEAARNFFAVVQPTDNTETILRKIKGQKSEYIDALSNAVDDYKMAEPRRKRFVSLVESSREQAPNEVVKEPTTSQKTAPEAALSFLKADPSQANKDFFKQKYGYLPKGY